MELFITLIAWYLIGFISSIYLTYVFEKKFTVRDFITSLFCGFLGIFLPVTGILYFLSKKIESNKIKINKILDKRIL